ncbi:MAG TPA: hypothetical protein VJ880_08545, partial [Allomuricauda sp.]|nr:hypothetical protein [Allomuricauda sp.]
MLSSLTFFGCKEKGSKNDHTVQTGISEPLGADNVAHKWSEMAIKATALDTERFNPRPTITSRFLGLTFVAMFDAWSRYDEKAIPVYMTGIARRQKRERTLNNKEIAVSYAAYRALNEYYYSDRQLFADFML